MANSYGDFNQTTANAYANGSDHDAAVRAYRKRFNLTTDADPAGGTANVLVGPRVREGSVPYMFHITSGANASGITFKIGTAANDSKYATGVTGPNNATVVVHALPAAMDDDALAAPEDIIFTPSGNLPASGVITVRVFATHR